VGKVGLSYKNTSSQLAVRLYLVFVFEFPRNITFASHENFRTYFYHVHVIRKPCNICWRLYWNSV